MDGDKEINKVAEPIETRIAFQSLEFEKRKADILPSMAFRPETSWPIFWSDHPPN